jgi:hypothetical protein
VVEKALGVKGGVMDFPWTPNQNEVGSPDSADRLIRPPGDGTHAQNGVGFIYCGLVDGPGGHSRSVESLLQSWL